MSFPLNGIFSWVLSSLFYSGNINSMCWKNKMKGDVCVCMCACVSVSESITSGSLSFFFFYFSGISHQSLKNNLMPWCNATPAGADWQTGFLLDILDAVCEVFIKLRYKNFIQEFICSNFSKRFWLGWSWWTPSYNLKYPSKAKFHPFVKRYFCIGSNIHN